MRPLAHVIDDAVAVQAERTASWPWSPTVHAAEQYRRRVDRAMALPAAWRMLCRILPAAELLPEPTLRGQQRWLLPGGDAVAVCKPDPKLRRRIAVTVLGPNEMHDVEAVGEVVEAYQRIAPVVEPTPVERPAPARLRAPTAVGDAAADLWERRFVALRAEHMRHLKLYADLKTRRSEEGAAHRRQIEALSAKHREEQTGLRRQIAALQEQLREEKRRVGAAEHAAKVADERFAKAQRIAASADEHVRHVTRDCAKKTIALREAVRELRLAADRGDGGARLALVAIAGIDPGLISDAFCFPERPSVEERCEAAQAEEGARP